MIEIALYFPIRSAKLNSLIYQFRVGGLRILSGGALRVAYLLIFNTRLPPSQPANSHMRFDIFPLPPSQPANLSALVRVTRTETRGIVSDNGADAVFDCAVDPGRIVYGPDHRFKTTR